MPSRAGAWFAMFMIIATGLGLLGVGTVSIATYHLDTSNAEPVEATIVYSDVRHETDAGSLNWELRVVYEFSCNGHRVRSGDVYAGIGPATLPFKSSLESIADRYEEGTNVTAYVVQYDGEGPGRYDCDEEGSYLVGEGPRYFVYYGFLAVGALVTWSGVGLWLYRVFGLDVPLRARFRNG